MSLLLVFSGGGGGGGGGGGDDDNDDVRTGLGPGRLQGGNSDLPASDHDALSMCCVL